MGSNWLSSLLLASCLAAAPLVHAEEAEGLALEGGLRFYGGETRRLFAYHAPHVDARGARDSRSLDHDLLGSWVVPDRVLVSSRIPGCPSDRGRWTRIARFRGPKACHSPSHDLSLYLYEPETD